MEFSKSTQQNAYSISHYTALLLHDDYHSDTVTYYTVTALHTPGTGYPLPWAPCRNLATRHLVGNYTGTIWAVTMYPITHSHRVGNQGGTDTRFYSLPLVPSLVGERIVTTLSVPCHSQHSDYT